MAPAIHPCLLLCLCLLFVAPHLSSCYHTSNTYGGRHVLVRSSHDSRIQSTFTSIPSGDGGLPVMHRLSPWSPSDAGVGDAFYRDTLRLHALFGDSTGTPLVALPGAFEYHVSIGYGTPAQKLTMGFDTATVGATFLRCKPCAAGDPCHKAFDPSRSSSLAQIPCGSQDCPFKACSGPTCNVAVTKKGAVVLNATFVTDTLTAAPAIPVNDFRFACLEMGGARTTGSDSSSGVLDLSRESHSLASRVVLTPETVTFSYCLPWDPTSRGFLSFGAARPERAGRGVTYATLRHNAARPSMYFVKLVGVTVGLSEIPVPPAPAIAGDALVEVHTTFTYLKPEVYAVLRDMFRRGMRQYVVAPSSSGLETCYDFTHLNTIDMPMISLRFEGGATLELGIEQMMYFKDPRNIFSVGCLAFAPVPAYAPVAAVIGLLAQSQTEVVYDVLQGKLGLVPDRC